MSNRYVWGRYDIQKAVVPSGGQTTAVIGANISHITLATAAAVSGNQIALSGITSIQTTGIGMMRFVSPGTYVTAGEDITITDPASVLLAVSQNSTIQGTMGGGGIAVYSLVNCNTVSISDTPGTLQGYASAAASSAYPQDGVSGSYWYEYQGSDSIDARGCAIFSR